MKLFVMVCSMLVSASAFAGVNFFSSADLPSSTYGIKLVDAEYKMIPTKTEERDIPGCNPNGEASQICTETVVLESAPAVAVNVSYNDSTFPQGDGYQPNWLTFLLDPATLPAADVAALKAASPAWRHPFSNEGRNFARRLLKLTVAKEARTIQVVDVRNSHLCPIGESGEPQPGCVETIVYKPAQTKVNAVSVSLK